MAMQTGVLGTTDIDNQAATRPAVWRERILPALVAGGLGLVLLYGAGFAETSALHNAAHDSRHSAGFPCH